MATTEEIHFCDATGPWACFSNYYEAEFEVDGKKYKSNEHYFQSQKFKGSDHEEAIINASSPGESKVLGYQRKPGFNPNWESVKVGVMKTGLTAKFSQHSDLKDILLSTGSKAIIERNDDDAYWGDGKDRQGLNMLGKCLMEVRDALKSSN